VAVKIVLVCGRMLAFVGGTPLYPSQPRPPRLPVLLLFWPICLPLGSPMRLSIDS
jgi:hypothetical protein